MGLVCSNQKRNHEQNQLQIKQNTNSIENDINKSNNISPSFNKIKNEIDIKVYSEIIQESEENIDINLLLNFKVSNELQGKIKKMPIDICILLDVSSTMNGQKLETIKQGLIVLLKILNKNDRICIITFRSKAKLHMQWIQNTQTNQDNIIQLIMSIQTSNNNTINKRDFTEAIEKSIELLDTSINTRIIFFLITDGEEYFTTNIDRLESQILRCSTPKHFQFESFSFDNFSDSGLLTQFVKFTKGSNTFITNIEDFSKLLIFKYQQLMELYAQAISIIIKTNNKYCLQVNSSKWRNYLQFSNNQISLNLNSIQYELEYYYPFKIVLKEKSSSLNDSTIDNIISIQINGQKLLQTEQIERTISISLKQIKNNIQANLVKQYFLLEQFLFNVLEQNQIYEKQDFNTFLQKLELIIQQYNLNNQSNILLIESILIVKQLLKHVKHISEIYNEYNKSKNQELIDQGNKEHYCVVKILRSLSNLIELQQDIDFKQTYTLSQSTLINQFNVEIYNISQSLYQQFKNVQQDYADDLNDSNSENFLYKATKMGVL